MSRHLHRLRLASTLVIFVVTLFPAARAMDVRLSDPVYSFLERADIRGWLDVPLSGAKPFSRLTIAQRISEAAKHRDGMTRVDRDQLDYFLYMYHDELVYLKLDHETGFRSIWEKWRSRPGWLFPNGRDALFYEGGPDDDWQIALNATAKLEVYDRLPEGIGDKRIRSTVDGNGGVLRFRAGSWSALGAVADNHAEAHPAITDSLRYPYKYSSPNGRDPSLTDFYDMRAELAWESRHVIVWFGSGRQRWGDANTGSLIINDYAHPYTHFRLTGRWGPFTYTNVQAHLQTEPRIVQVEEPLPYGGTRPIYAQKWFAAQRFEANLARDFRFAFFEEVIYGERGYDVEYLSPLMFIQGQEHYTGDPDNMMLGGDMRWLLFQHLELHSQVLLDEFVFSLFGSNNFSNKWAYLGGLKWEDAFNVPNSQFFVEYARIRPYVYTHKYPINTATQLNANLGYGMPPNSDNLVVGWTQRVARGAEITVSARVLRHGDNTDSTVVGGDVRFSDQAEHALYEVPFLAGDRTTQKEVMLAARIEPILHLQLDLSMRYVDRELSPEFGTGALDNHLLWQALLRWYPVF